eukprot:13014704-Alexandrium_andersonii.AAC.1
MFSVGCRGRSPLAARSMCTCRRLHGCVALVVVWGCMAVFTMWVVLRVRRVAAQTLHAAHGQYGRTVVLDALLFPALMP